jgi:hypothetical protein
MVTTGAIDFRWIAEAALRNRNSSFVIDGEAVLLAVDGRREFFDPPQFHSGGGEVSAF